MSAIIYSGTFDPITLGHIDLIERAAGLFDRVILAVADSPKKSPLFNLEERIGLSERSLSHLSNIEIRGFTGLTVDLARETGALSVLRGVRSVVDYEYELQMHKMNRDMLADFETIFLAPDNRLAHISSTLVREISALGGDVSGFVSAPVLSALQIKHPQT